MAYDLMLEALKELILHLEKPKLLICESKFKLVRINGHQTDVNLHHQISSDKFMVGSHSVSFQLIWHKSAYISL